MPTTDRTTRWRQFSQEYAVASEARLPADALAERHWDTQRRPVATQSAAAQPRPLPPIDWDVSVQRVDQLYRGAYTAPRLRVPPRRSYRTQLPTLRSQPALLALLVLGTLLGLWQLLAPASREPELGRFYNTGTTSVTFVGQAAAARAVAPLGPDASTAFLPLPASGPFRLNVAAALNANGGALQRVVIPAGESWSFNRAVGDPSVLTLATIAGVYGGGWCDLASRYVVALRPILPREALVFPRHRDTTGIGLSGVSDDDAVAIWNTNNQGAEQDLIIHNPTQQTLVLTAQLGANGVEVRAALQ